MTAARIAGLLVRLITVVVAVASAVYVVLYLYRWEWHRALMSGVIFVAAELGLVGALLLGRMEAFERRVNGGIGSAAGSPAVRAPSPAGSRSQPFAWIDPNRLGVFIPVLMGAGAVLSGLAYVVERFARFVAVEPRASGRATSALPELPQGGFLGGVPPGSGPARRRRGRILLVSVALLAAAFIVVALVDVVADVTQSRPDPVRPGLATEIELTIGYHSYDRRSALGAASALVEACRTTVPERTRFGSPQPLDGRRVLVVARPALGAHEVRRFRGCVGDSTLDRVHATIDAVRMVDDSA